MKHVALVVIVGVLVGCSRKKPEEGIEPPPAAPQPGSAGSAAIDAAKPVTGAALSQRYDECWAFFNKEKKDNIDCLASDVVAERPGAGVSVTGAAAVVEATKGVVAAFPDFTVTPELELVHGHQIASIVFATGTHTGALGAIAPTKKKIGFLIGHLSELDDTARVKHYWEYLDAKTMLGQLQPAKNHPTRPALDKAPIEKTVVIAKDDATEQANVETVTTLWDAYDKHDGKAVGALLADDVIWSEQAEQKDWTKAEVLKSFEGGWQAFADLKAPASTTWAAGDYVVRVATASGTGKDKKSIALPFLTIHKLAGGKITATWLFEQHL